MSRTLRAPLVLLAGSLLAPAVAQQAPAEAPEVGDEVVVRGRRMSDIEDGLRAEIGKFIGEIAAPLDGRGLARWDREICVGVHNIEREAGQYLVDHVSAVALDVGLTPEQPGCNPDVIIIFTTDAKMLAAHIVETQEKLLRPTSEGGVHRGVEAMNEFAASDSAVRWWHVSMPVDARTGQPAIYIPGTGTAPAVTVAGPSRLHAGVRDAMQYVIVLVDATKLTGMTWQQLGDYLAVVSLAQIELGANPSAFDSILNLFTNPAAYSGLTDWDRSYLRALYAFDQERNPRIQRSNLVSYMLRREIEPDR